MISFLRDLIMPDDSLPPADKAVVAFFEIVAFALGWDGVARLLDGKSWLSVLPILAATILTSYTGFKWAQIKLKVGNRLGLTGQYRSILAVATLLLLTAYDFYDRHVNGALALVPWWHYGPILLGVAAVIWLMIGGLLRNEPSKLVIHRAVYAAGLQTEVSVTDKLKNAVRDALVITVDNTLGNLLPRDPAFNVRKRLDVDYSYGSDTVFHVSRIEPPVGETGRLLLPEDSEVQRLTDEIVWTKQETAEQIGRLTIQHKADEYKSHQIRDDAQAELRAMKENMARPRIVPVRYGMRSSDGRSGLFLANEGGSAYDITVPDIEFGTSKLVFQNGNFARLVKSDGDCFCETWIQLAPHSGVLGEGLFHEMASQHVDAIELPIRYKDVDNCYYITNCAIERDVKANGGLAVRFLGQGFDQAGSSPLRIVKLSDQVEYDATATYPLKVRMQLRNDSTVAVDVQLQEYRPDLITVRALPTEVFQSRLRDLWYPKEHGAGRIALYPGQQCQAWITPDDGKFNREQVEAHRGRIGTLVLRVNGQDVEIKL
jgi:hypothetical protein